MKLVLGVIKYLVKHGYLDARVRGMKALLLPATTLRSFISFRNLEELVSSLEATPYREEMTQILAEDLNARTIEQALSANFLRTIESIERDASGKIEKFVKEYLKKYEIENLKAIIRGIASNTSPEEIMRFVIPVGRLSESTLFTLANSSDLEAFVIKIPIKDYQDVLEEALEKYEETGELLQIEIALDALAYGKLWEYVKKLHGRDKSHLKKLIGTTIDTLNIWIILRCKLLGIPYKVIAEEYDLNIDYKLTEVIRSEAIVAETVEQALDIFAVDPYKRTLMEAKKEFIADNSLHPIETHLKRFQVQQNYKIFQSYPFHIGIFAGFINLKWFEIWNIRAIAEGIEGRLPPERIENFVIIP